MEKADRNPVLDGMMGLCVGDALGVPVEFMSREVLQTVPVLDMRGYGTHHQPPGTWSDDTSMTICLAESLTRCSLSKGLDYGDIMNNFRKWYNDGEFTPYGEVFDVGISTGAALNRFLHGVTPLACGGTGERDNGNGSLMRILPLLFYLQAVYGTDFTEQKNGSSSLNAEEEAFAIIHNVSALTHGHKRSKLACGIYLCVASQLTEAKAMKHKTVSGVPELKTAVEKGVRQALAYYQKHSAFQDELISFARLMEDDFARLDERAIKSSGYVVDTLEAALWCLFQTHSYQECVLQAVNLGGDTDTVAAVAGGLAGLYYGYEQIPEEWLATIAQRPYLEELCHKLHSSLYLLQL